MNSEPMTSARICTNVTRWLKANGAKDFVRVRLVPIAKPCDCAACAKETR